MSEKLKRDIGHLESVIAELKNFLADPSVSIELRIRLQTVVDDLSRDLESARETIQ